MCPLLSVGEREEVMTNTKNQWEMNGSWGMLMVTDDRIYFIIKAYEDLFGNWKIKEAVHLRTYQPSKSPVDIISQFATVVEGEAKSPMFYRICPGRNYVNFIIPSDEIKATYPLSEKQMKEVVDEQSKHGNKALNSGLSITEFTWLVRSQEEQQ